MRRVTALSAAEKQCAVLVLHLFEHSCLICFERFVDPPGLHMPENSRAYHTTDIATTVRFAEKSELVYTDCSKNLRSKSREKADAKERWYIMSFVYVSS